MVNGIVLVGTVVVEVGASAVGLTGMIAEYATKFLDKETLPVLREVGELFSKTLQNGSAAFSLIIIGSLFNPLAVIPTTIIGSILVLTPISNSVVKNLDFLPLKGILEQMDKGASLSGKMVNGAVLTAGAYLALGIPALVITGVGLGAANYWTFTKG